MWGDPQRASTLESSDALAGLLFQITGPAHIPWNDPRWQELFLGYDVWVHIEHGQHNVVEPACASMAKHADTSSNLAALALHVARMTKELQKAVTRQEQSPNENDNDASGFTRRIALVGKARATAGALRLIRILMHNVLKHSTCSESLHEVLMYRSREVSDRASLRNVDAGAELLSSLLSFCSHMGDTTVEETGGGGGDALSQLKSVPELYDATVLSLELLMVLFSSQLYQPMVSSTQRRETTVSSLSRRQQEKEEEDGANYFLDQIMAEAEKRQYQQRKRQKEQQHAFLIANDNNNNNDYHHTDETTMEAQPLFLKNSPVEKLDWSPQSVLKACITWLIQRPRAPVRSIAHHNAELAHAVVQAKGEKVGPDGMYESHVIVMAAMHSKSDSDSSEHGNTNQSTQLATHNNNDHSMMRPPSQLILDATKGVLVLSSTLILLPFRLMSLAFGLWGSKHDAGSVYDKSRMVQLRSSAGGSRRTNDVLWLSESPIADLGCTLFLILTNNHRVPREESNEEGNPFRSELAALNDNRWEGSDSFGSNAEAAIPDPLGHAVQDNNNNEGTELESFINEPNHENRVVARLKHRSGPRQLLTTNFESLFEAFGNIVHTEVGALALYTVLQSSPIFAASVAVRSDLDKLVLPLLRTLYFASAIGHYSPKDFPSSPRQSTDGPQAQRSCPFRSQSQLYVILILLLLFSQDASFGSDAFRRVTVSNVVWYKERNLKDINLGSVLLLTLLRSIAFNTNRLRDAFLLSNCCAVLMNLSPNIVNIHEYAAMRLASVTMSTLKRYSVLVAKNGGKVSSEEDISTDVGMYGEVSRTLLRLLRHCVGPKNIDKNVHLVYALVYHQSDFHNIVSKDNCPFTSSEIGRIEIVMSEAAKVIQEDGDARTAPKALNVLKNQMGRLKESVTIIQPLSSMDSGELAAMDDAGDFTFTYEEEADPEIFFIPYIWEVVVCVVTVSSVEWDKDHIQVFPLIETDDDDIPQVNGTAEAAPKGYSDDVSNVV